MSSDDKKEILEQIERLSSLTQQGIANLGTRLEALENELNSQGGIVSTMRAEFNTRFDKIESELKSFRSETEKEFRLIQRQFDKMLGELSRQRAAHDDLEERFNKIEKQPV
jgi:chromosome segregation ATPase